MLRKVDKAHEEGIWSVAWRRNKIITGSADGKIKCWNEQLEKRFEHDASPLGVVSVDMETFGARTLLVVFVELFFFYIFYIICCLRN